MICILCKSEIESVANVCKECNDSLKEHCDYATLEVPMPKLFHNIKNNNQPERSKREDLNCDNCKIPRVFNCCWMKERHENNESCQQYQFKMRCSEHCSNAVREAK